MNEYKFNLMNTVSNEGKFIFRYKSERNENMMWRETKEEAKADFYRWFLNKKDTAKGLNEMEELKNIIKYNKDLIN